MVFKTLSSFEYSAFAFRDSWKTIGLTVLLFLSLALALAWITTNVVGQTNVVFVYTSLLYLWAAAYAANLVKKMVQKLQPLPFGTVALGWHTRVIALLGLAGLALGYYLVSQHLTIALPLDVAYKQAVLSMDYIYKVIMSPIIEEGFRAVMLLSTALLTWHYTKNWWAGLLVGLLVSAFAFGIFHWLAYQQDFAFIGAAIIFGLVAGMLMILSKSVVPSILFHFANNQLIFSNGDATMLVVAGGLVAAILALTFFGRRFKWFK